MRFHIDVPMLKYFKRIPNSCCFSSLESYFDIIDKIKDANAISKCIEESFTSQVGFRNRIDFANAVLKNQKIVKGEKKLYYNLNMFKQKGYLNIFKYTSEHVTLAPLMDSMGKVNNAISVFGYWIFEPKN